MRQCVYSIKNENKTRSVTQINSNQFIIEGYVGKTKLGGESEYSISYIDFDNGPYLHIGSDFFGRGKISNLEIIDSNIKNYIIVKISLIS